MTQVKTRLALTGSGAILTLFGGALLIDPKTFLEMSHVLIERDAGLMSELTAPSGVLVLTGAFMMLAAFRLRLANTALFVGAIIYGSYGISRVISMALHGIPSESLVTATVIELAVAFMLSVLGITNRVDQDLSDTSVPLLQAGL